MAACSVGGRSELCIPQANRVAPDGTPHLGLYCLPMSHKKNAMLIQVKGIQSQTTKYYLYERPYVAQHFAIICTKINRVLRKL